VKETSKTQIELARSIKNLMHRLRQSMDKQLSPLGITTAQYAALSVLIEQPEVSGAEIARKCRVTPQTAHQLLTALEANGWVKREKHPSNEKVLWVKLTTGGETIVKKARPERLKVVQTMLKGFSPADLNKFTGFLDRCRNNLPGGMKDA